MEDTDARARTDPRIDLLVGEWRGKGCADFPTIDRVEFTEELSVEWDPGREVLCYQQRAVLADGTPSHREFGFIRLSSDGSVEVWNAQDNGRTEVLRGSSAWNDSTRALEIELGSVAFGNDPRMLGSRRRLGVSPGRLWYELSMSTTTVEETVLLPHLSAELARLR